MDTDQKLQEITDNQKKIIEQNRKIIRLLERMNTNIINMSQKRQIVS
jgi:hypothetical protein